MSVEGARQGRQEVVERKKRETTNTHFTCLGVRAFVAERKYWALGGGPPRMNSIDRADDPMKSRLSFVVRRGIGTHA